MPSIETYNITKAVLLWGSRLEPVNAVKLLRCREDFHLEVSSCILPRVSVFLVRL